MNKSKITISYHALTIHHPLLTMNVLMILHIYYSILCTWCAQRPSSGFVTCIISALFFIFIFLSFIHFSAIVNQVFLPNTNNTVCETKWDYILYTQSERAKEKASNKITNKLLFMLLSYLLSFFDIYLHSISVLFICCAIFFGICTQYTYTFNDEHPELTI